MKILVRCFIYSAGSIFLFESISLVLCNMTAPPDLAPVQDPLLGAPVPRIFWIIAAINALLATSCLFGKARMFQVMEILFAALIFLCCRIALAFFAVCDGFAGYLGGIAVVLGLGAHATDSLLILTNVYLTLGGITSLFCSVDAAESRSAVKRIVL